MSTAPSINWTPAQQQAIDGLGSNILVTASAGTGKTAVLSHRAVERIGASENAVRADAMLVLTFTEAAAEEMRSRIAETLYNRYLQTRQSRLRQQLLLLDRAYISTIHSFCKRILTEFFYLIDLDPAFGIMDADEQRLLKSDLLSDTLEEAWANEELAAGMKSLFAGRRVQPGTNSFVDLIIPLTEFLDSVVSRKAFYQHALAAAQPGTAEYAALGHIQKEMVLTTLSQCRQRLEHAIRLDSQYCQSQYATTYILEKILPIVAECTKHLARDNFERCAELLSNPDFGTLRKKKNTELTADQQALIKDPIDRVKKELKGLPDLSLLCADYESQLAAQAAAQTQVMLELMQRFDAHYANAKKNRNMLDFADLEHFTLNLLQSHPEIQEKLRQRFEFIFVDEYQDINAPQQKILELVSRPDNVFVVGDVKQSIYGFRQSKPEIFLSELEKAGDSPKDPTRVDLQDNFRCRAQIIDFVNAMFARTMTPAVAQMEYDKRAELISGFNYPPFEAHDGPDHPVELVLLNDRGRQSSDEDDEDTGPPAISVSAAQRQAAWIAERIQKIVGAKTAKAEFQVFDKKSGRFRDVQYRDIVILMRSLSHKARDYTEMLRLAGIPVQSQSACGYFEATEISDCLCLLKVLDNPDRDIELAALLRGPVFGVTDSELATVRLHAGPKVGFYSALRKYITDTSDSPLSIKLGDALSQINHWRRQVRTGSLADFLDAFFREQELLSFYAALPNGAQRRANLLKLHDHAIRFEHFRTTEPGMALGRFVEFLEKLDDAQQDWAPAEPDDSAQNAVRIMSIHKSKGLEFPVVFAAELNTPFNMRDASGGCLINEHMLGLQIVNPKTRRGFPTTARQIIADQTRRKTMAEEMRILYVALTRAREKLILTGSKEQQSCAKLLLQCAAMERQLPEWQLCQTRCHLDWVLAGLADQRRLHQLFETQTPESLQDDALMEVYRVQPEELETIAQNILESKRQQAEKPKPAKTSAAAFETIRQNLQWQYAFKDIAQTPAKLSVSELTHRDDEFASVNLQQVFSQTPAALRAETAAGTGPDARSMGTAVHLVFENIDLTSPVNADTIRQAVAKLATAGQLDTAIAEKIDTEGIASFFDTDLGRLARQAADKVLREWSFTYALDASAIGTASADETVVLQGVIDMIIPAADGLVIVDFKTDNVTENNTAERAEKYAAQLRLYAQAAADILNQTTTAAWLYFLTPKKAAKIQLL